MPKISCADIREEVLFNVKHRIEELECVPTLAIITCSDDKPSVTYVNNKKKTMESVGIQTTHYNLDPENETTESVCELVFSCCRNFNGVLVQLPLAEHLDEELILSCITSDRDVDGLHPDNVAKLVMGKENEALIPCTALAVFEIMKRKFGEDLSRVDVQVINRSRLIGKPLTSLLLNHNATPHVYHSKSASIHYDMPSYDVIVTGIGKPRIVNCHYMRDYTTVIDCGISYVNGHLVRDVAYEEEDKIDYYYNVGVLTTAFVAVNVLKAYELQNKCFNK